jgi:hypothetical protein
MRTSAALALAALLMPLPAIYAQQPQNSTSPALYKVEFTIHDGSDAAAKAARHYTLLTDANEKAVLKVGNRVPIATGSSAGGTVTQYTYIDVGVNIECVLRDMGGKIAMHGTVDLSTITQHDAAPGAANPPNPTVGQTRLELNTAVTPGRPTVVAAIEDPATMRQFQVEATVTKAD